VTGPRSLNGRRTRADALNGNGLGPLGAGWEGLLWLVKSSVEEGVNKRRFSETGFTLKRQKRKRHDAFLTLRQDDRDDLPTTMAVNWKPFLTLFL
jgi:hypothetical protein